MHQNAWPLSNQPGFRIDFFGILGFGIWNSAQGIRNSANPWNVESKFHWQEICNPVLESEFQNPR